MKNLRLFSCLVLFPVFLLTACASRPRQTVEKTPAENPPAEIFRPREELPPSLEQALKKVKNNGKDMEKFFIADEKGRIIVKAVLRDETGDFEITYDLENARAVGTSSYEVDFSFHVKESGLFVKDTLVWNPQDGGGGLLLSFDDDYADSWERYFDLFDKYKARVTFFLQGKTGPFCVKAVNRGHDIGFHSLNHPDLRKIPRAEFDRETVGAAESFREAGFPLSSFAYPYGFSDPWMNEALLRSFRLLRGYGTTFRLYNEDEIKRGYISSRAIDNTVIPDDEDFYRVVGTMLMAVKFLDNNQVLPLTTHDISDTAHWGIKPRRLEFLLKTASGLGLSFYRYSDFAGQ